MKSESGQMAMMAVLIIVVLVLGIAVVAFLNQTQGWFGVANQQRSHAALRAEEGLSYAIHTLAQDNATWQAALQGVFPAGFDGSTQFNPGGTPYPFTITCTKGTADAAYETGVLVTSYTLPPSGNPIPLRSLSALVSQKTMAINMPNNITASVALEVLQAPSFSTFTIQWGPIAVYDSTNVWTIQGGQATTGANMDLNQYPRKFSQNGITSSNKFRLRSESTATINTDNEEYWAYASLGYAPDINLGAYQALAQATPLANPPTDVNGVNLVPTNCNTAAPGVTATNCANFEIATATAVFGANNTLQTINQPGAVIYVDGNVEFDRVAIDLKGNGTKTPDNLTYSAYPAQGALIVAATGGGGNMYLSPTIKPNDGLSDGAVTLRIPPTANVEYPYGIPNSVVPCPSNLPSGPFYCAASSLSGGGNSHVQFRGFLYVQGNLTHQPQGVGTPSSWFLVGATRVDGQIFTINTPNPLVQFIYDDEINRSILTTNLELQVDSKKFVGAH